MINRRSFIGGSSALLAVSGFASSDKNKEKKVIQGFDETFAGELSQAMWKPFSDKVVRVGIAGEGVASFGSSFAYQSHPNVEVVSVTDLNPERCKLLQERTRAKKTYPSCEQLIKNAAADKIEALYIATDAPSHARLAIMALEHGLHVASACPAFFGKDQLDLVPKIIEAAKKTRAHSFIKRMANGYDTLLSEDGGNLSEGQKQLLCITRVMLALPPMLILDEATSSIDTRTEKKISEAFNRLTDGKTSFIVAHRLSTIVHADTILVMEAGHVVEQGTHAELLSKNGAYARLYNSQYN
jgi:ABC-type dipeptide/oligopeptide/nickel transport system ATPase subunit